MKRTVVLAILALVACQKPAAVPTAAPSGAAPAVAAGVTASGAGSAALDGNWSLVGTGVAACGKTLVFAGNQVTSTSTDNNTTTMPVTIASTGANSFAISETMGNETGQLGTVVLTDPAHMAITVTSGGEQPYPVCHYSRS